MRKSHILISALIIIDILLLVLISVIIINIKNKNSEIIGENLYTIECNESISSENKKIEIVENLIRNSIDKKFDIKDYEINEYSNNPKEKSYTIDMNYKINDIYTNLGYQVFIDNNIITEISTNAKGINVNKYKKNLSVFKQDFTYLEKEIKANLELNKNVKVKEQKIKKMYDLFENVKKVVVLTNYEEQGVEKTTSSEKILK